MNIRDIVKQYNYSYSHFRKRFRQKYGISPAKFRIARRIEKAKAYLDEGELSVKQIAIDLGYPDTFTFSKQFKKITGLSPVNFRKQTQGS